MKQNIIDVSDAIIARLRNAAKIYSLRELDDYCGVSYEGLRRIIDGRTVNVKIESLAKIDLGLDVLEKRGKSTD